MAPAGLGLGTIDQLVPFHRSTNVLESSVPPTAEHVESHAGDAGESAGVSRRDDGPACAVPALHQHLRGRAACRRFRARSSSTVPVHETFCNALRDPPSTLPPRGAVPTFDERGTGVRKRLSFDADPDAVRRGCARDSDESIAGEDRRIRIRRIRVGTTDEPLPFHRSIFVKSGSVRYPYSPTAKQLVLVGQEIVLSRLGMNSDSGWCGDRPRGAVPTFDQRFVDAVRVRADETRRRAGARERSTMAAPDGHVATDDQLVPVQRVANGAVPEPAEVEPIAKRQLAALTHATCRSPVGKRRARAIRTGDHRPGRAVSRLIMSFRWSRRR